MWNAKFRLKARPLRRVRAVMRLERVLRQFRETLSRIFGNTLNRAADYLGDAAAKAANWSHILSMSLPVKIKRGKKLKFFEVWARKDTIQGWSLRFL